MKIYILFAGINLNLIIQKKAPENVCFMDDALKTRGIEYLNVETWLLFAPLSEFLTTRLPLARAEAVLVYSSHI